MPSYKSLASIGSVVFLLFACSPTPATTQPATPAAAESATRISQPTPAELKSTAVTTQASPETEPVLEFSQTDPYPLAESSAYKVGKRQYTFVDPARGDRQVGVTVWYPAFWPEDYNGKLPVREADPDLSGAPYPLILSSTKHATIFAPYLVTHGYTWASVDRIDTYLNMEYQMFEQPLDILFALDQVSSQPLEGLEGMIDSQRVGVTGYSFDGYNTLAMSGARIDPQWYLDQCTEPEATKENGSAFSCLPAGEWEEYTSKAGEVITTSEDGLWQPMTDSRIRAVMPLAGEGWWLFGERGLAAVNRPVLIIVAAGDELYPENVRIFEHLGTTDKALISFLGEDHMMVYDKEMVARMAHFAAAFFGVHLHGRQDLSWYYSQEFVEQHEDLVWGLVP